MDTTIPEACMSIKKLLTDDLVEVRQKEKGLRGSWHPGVVFKVKPGRRLVKYDELLTMDGAEKLVESVPVTRSLDGAKVSARLSSNLPSRKERGLIRPRPPPYPSVPPERWKQGLWVDAFINDAWWEGVMMEDLVDSDLSKVIIFFPDEDEEATVPFTGLRIGQEWDEESGLWRLKGFSDVYKKRRRLDSMPDNEAVKDVTLTRNIVEDVLSKDLTKDFYSSRKSFESGISTEGAILFEDTVEDVTLPECMVKDSNMLGAIIKDADLAHTINMAEEGSDGIDLSTDVAACASVTNYIVQVVNLPECFSADVNLLEDIPEDLKASNGITESLDLFKDMVGNINDISQETKLSENGPDDANLIADIAYTERITKKVSLSADITNDITTSKDFSENLTLADWMKLEKLSFAEMKKRSSASCSTITPNSKCDLKAGGGNGRGRGKRVGRGQLQRNVLSRSLGSMSAVESSCSRSQLTSQIGFKFENNGKPVGAGHGDRISSEKVVSIQDLTQATWLSPKLLKVARDRAKIILQRAGYTICFRARVGKTKGEPYYLDPEGRAYYSLVSACNNWKLQSSLPVSSEERQTMQLVSMHRLTKKFIRDQDSCKRDISLRSNRKHYGQIRDGYRGSSCQTMEGSASVLSVFGADLLTLSKVDVPAQVMNKNLVKQQLIPYTSSLSGELRHWKRRLRWWSNARKRNCQVLGQELAAGNLNQPHFSHCLGILLSPPVRGKVDDDSIGAYAMSKRTILCWLIDLALVEENEKVHYMRKTDVHSMLEGRVTREGILCSCCNATVPVAVFAAHAGSKVCHPSSNIIFKDGRSLLECQIQALNVQGTPKKLSRSGQNDFDESDDTCGVCGDGGELICCDHCPSTFHFTCINLEFQDVPEGEWCCPNCRCTLCGGSELNGNKEYFDEMTKLFCDQCERGYHVGCLYTKGIAKMDVFLQGSWFCSSQCEEIFQSLRALVGTTHILEDGFSCILLRSTEEDNQNNFMSNVEVVAECSSKLALALTVMQECFRPMIDTRTQLDIISHVVYNRWGDVNRLNFRGFYTVVLERDEELISVACIRVHGCRVAEMPLIGTRFQYRRQGMCRRLVNVIERMLENLKVETFLLPAVPDLLKTWTIGFNFQSLTAAQKLELAELNVLAFPGSTLLQKPLQNSNFQASSRTWRR